MMKAPFKIGILADSPVQSGVTADFIRDAASCGLVVAEALILQNLAVVANEAPFQRLLRVLRRHGAAKLARIALLRLIERAEMRAFRGRTEVRNFLRRENIQPLFARVLSITPMISRSGHVYTYSEDDVSRIESYDLDYIINCGSGILHGRVLEAARGGIISFHHGDNRLNRGGPPGFWEVYLRQEASGFTVQRLTEELDGGVVQLRGTVSTKSCYALNHASLYANSYHYLKENIASLGDISRNGAESLLLYSNRLYTYPSLLEIAKYLVRQLEFGVRCICRRLLRRDEIWHVGVAKVKSGGVALWHSKQIPRIRGHFYADPFVVPHGDRRLCFLEDYDYNAGLADIKVFDVTGPATMLGTAIRESLHLSFPFVFELEGKHYCIPETSRNRDLRVYEATDFPLKWKLHSVLAEGCSIVDTIVFAHGGLWWRFSNEDRAGFGDHNVELRAYFATAPVGCEWKPHALNPLYVDARKARNGGMFQVNGETFRVVQRHRFGKYGAGAIVRRICKLSPDEFVEEDWQALDGGFRRGCTGIHHFHLVGDTAVFDFTITASI